jgi:MYXO-CTERM domain-containing protein
MGTRDAGTGQSVLRSAALVVVVISPACRCPPLPTPIDTGEPCEERPWELDDHSRTIAPWGGVVATLDEGRCGGREPKDPIPLVVDQAGHRVALQPLGQCRWAPESRWRPGDYHIEGASVLLAGESERRELQLDEPAPVTVDPLAQRGALDTSALEGTAWALDLVTVDSCGSLAGLLIYALETYGFADSELILQLDEVTGSRADFRLIWRGLPEDAPYPACTLLTERTTLTPAGMLRWMEEERQLASSPPIPAWDLALLAGWSPDDAYAAGMELWLIADTAELAGWVGGGDERRLCEWALTAGTGCEPCPDGEGNTCVPLELFEGELAPTTAFPDKLPACEVAFWKDSVPDPDDCGFSCAEGQGPGTAMMLLSLVGLAGHRRRLRPRSKESRRQGPR